MAAETERFASTNKGYMLREQLLTTEDLREFKTELLQEIRQMMETQNGFKPKKWLKSPEVRKMLNISPGTLQNLRINGTLPYTKMGGVIYYDYEDILRVMQQNRVDNSR